MTASWAGVFPALTTKFKPDGSLDSDAMRRHFAWQIEAGVDGLIACGSLGENSALSFAEKLTVLRLALEASSGRVPVLAAVAENTTAEAIRLIEAATHAGADGFMALPPMRYIADRRETLAYYRALAEASPKPIMVYNNPVAYGVDVTPEMFAELADVPRLVAIKESSDNVRRITDIIGLTGDRYALFCGVDDLALEAMLMGAVGWVAGLVNAFPRETVAIHRLVHEKRMDEALAIYRWFAPLLHLDVSRKLVQNIKLVEALAGVGSEAVRPPRLPLEGEERARIEETFATAMRTRPVLPDWRYPHAPAGSPERASTPPSESNERGGRPRRRFAYRGRTDAPGCAGRPGPRNRLDGASAWPCSATSTTASARPWSTSRAGRPAWSVRFSASPLTQPARPA